MDEGLSKTEMLTAIFSIIVIVSLLNVLVVGF